MSLPKELVYFQYSQVHMGGQVQISGYAQSAEQGKAASEAAFKRFAELEQIMSDYRANSELSVFCASAGKGPQKISHELFGFLEQAKWFSELSGGAFDLSCGPLVQLWREARKTGRLPDPQKLVFARSLVGYQHLLMDPITMSASLAKPGMKVDLGGIGKGIGCSEAIEKLTEFGVERALVEAGGDMEASGPPPGKLGWKVQVRGVKHPPIWLKNQGLSTSGDSEQYVEVKGVRYSHIVDPRTGYGITNRKQASVLARYARWTDALATALCILPEDEGVELASKFGAKTIFGYPAKAVR